MAEKDLYDKMNVLPKLNILFQMVWIVALIKNP